VAGNVQELVFAFALELRLQGLPVEAPVQMPLAGNDALAIVFPDHHVQFRRYRRQGGELFTRHRARFADAQSKPVPAGLGGILKVKEATRSEGGQAIAFHQVLFAIVQGGQRQQPQAAVQVPH